MEGGKGRGGDVKWVPWSVALHMKPSVEYMKELHDRPWGWVRCTVGKIVKHSK